MLLKSAHLMHFNVIQFYQFQDLDGDKGPDVRCAVVEFKCGYIMHEGVKIQTEF